MYSIGHKIEVPPADNSKAWDLFYDHLTQPQEPWVHSLCENLDPERHKENQHWTSCKLRKDLKGKGCSKCEVIGRRVPDAEQGNWNDVIY